MRNKLLGILVGGALAVTASNASAAPMLAIDLDTTMMGIQSMLSFDVGAAPASISAAVVAFDPMGLSFADTVGLDVTSSMTSVGALGPVTTLGGLFPFAIDLFSFAAVAPGAVLTPFGAPSAGSLGLLGFGSLAGPGILGAVPVSLIDFTILPGMTVGSTTFTIVPGAGGALFLAGFPVATGGAGATLTLTDSGPVPVPEPGALLLFGAGLLGLAGLRRRRKV